MLDTIRTALWNQFGAAIETLERGITACPDALWEARVGVFPYWYMAYHTLFWMDFYLSDSPEGFSPPPPFDLSEFDPDGKMPGRVYAREELLAYLEHGRAKARAKIEGMTEETAKRRFKSEWMDFSALELMLYNLRHIQHHSAQMGVFLRQQVDDAPRWVSGARNRREWPA